MGGRVSDYAEKLHNLFLKNKIIIGAKGTGMVSSFIKPTILTTGEDRVEDELEKFTKNSNGNNI